MESFKTWQEYFDKMKTGAEGAANRVKDKGDDLTDAFKAGYEAAKSKTEELVRHEYTPLEKGLILGGILLAGILIGMLIAPKKKSKACCKPDAEDFEEAEK